MNDGRMFRGSWSKRLSHTDTNNTCQHKKLPSREDANQANVALSPSSRLATQNAGLHHLLQSKGNSWFIGGGQQISKPYTTLPALQVSLKQILLHLP